jgi:hypothetical protein
MCVSVCVCVCVCVVETLLDSTKRHQIISDFYTLKMVQTDSSDTLLTLWRLTIPIVVVPHR